MRRLFSTLTILSLGLLVISTVLWMVSHFHPITSGYIKIQPGFSRIYKFDLADGRLRLEMEERSPAPPGTPLAFVTRSSSSSTYELGWLMVYFLILPTMWLVDWIAGGNAHRREKSGRCPQCGYDLRASKYRCPECGTAIDRAPRRVRAAIASHTLYDEIHSFRCATDEDRQKVNHPAYDDTELDLTRMGFRRLGDVVDETLERLSGISAVIRTMVSPDGMTIVGFCHLNSSQLPQHLADRQLFVCDFVTEFMDGTFLRTANSQGFGRTTSGRIGRRQYTMETPLKDLAKAHEREKQKQFAAKSSGDSQSAVVINTLDDALESNQKQQTIAKYSERAPG